MKYLEILKTVDKISKQLEVSYCLIGGHAASLYRAQERFTKDIDFALMAETPAISVQKAEELISRLGLQPLAGFIPRSSHEPDRKNICMVSSKPQGAESRGIIDILLPELPWISDAIRRSQYNLIKLGFADIPVITPEDLIIAKCYALRNAPDRFQDLDDLKEIFNHQKDLDLEYLEEKLLKHALSIPGIITNAPRPNKR